MLKFSEYLIRSKRRSLLRSLFENITNECNDNKIELPSSHYLCNEIDQIAQDCQIDPEERGPKIDNIALQSLYEVDNGDHFIAEIHGGANGSGDLIKYIALIKKFSKLMKQHFANVWLIDWKNDCCDDLWDLQLGFRLNDEDISKYQQKKAHSGTKGKLNEDKHTYLKKYAAEEGVEEVVQDFWNIRHKLKPPLNDIDFWIKKPFSALQTFVINFDNKNKSQRRSEKAKQLAEENGAEMLGIEDGYEIWYVPSYEAAVQLGRFYKNKSCKWCISSEDPSFWFENHAESEFIFLIRTIMSDDVNDKIAVEFEDGGNYFNIDNIRTWNIDNEDEETFFNDRLIQYAWELMKDNGMKRSKWH